MTNGDYFSIYDVVLTGGLGHLSELRHRGQKIRNFLRDVIYECPTGKGKSLNTSSSY